jgi:hypothetical protein
MCCGRRETDVATKSARKRGEATLKKPPPSKKQAAQEEAAEWTCSVEGCGRTFPKGEGGADGKCWMHYRRALRKSPNANVPGVLRDGSRGAKITAYVTDAAETGLKAVAATRSAKRGREVSVSEVVADAIDALLRRMARRAERTGAIEA